MSRNVSNSEVTCWLTCRKQYDYAFMRNLAPKVTATPLARGTLGHEAFQRYCEARLEGATHDQALRAGQQVFVVAMQTMSIDIVLQTKMIWERYMAHHNGWPEWKILGTEQAHELPMTDSLTLPIRYDLMVEEVRTGKVGIIDYKFTYEFWSPEDHDLNGQMPKYIVVMNQNGIRVDFGALEELRTRPLGKEKSSDPKSLWRRTHYYPSLARKRNVIKQHVAASLEIESYRNLDDHSRDNATIPTLNKHGACKYCNFKDLCNSELDGKDITYDIEVGYVENTYGYNKTIDEPIKEAL